MSGPAAGLPVDAVGAPMRVAPVHVAALVVTGFGLLFDTLAATMTSVLTTMFGGRADVSRADLTLLLVALFAGGALGAPFAGAAADRFGRRKALIASLLGYSLASIAAGLTTDLRLLAVWRFVGGIFLAGYVPIMWTYLAEVLPPARRGRLMMIAGAAAAFGSVLAPMLSRLFDIHRLAGLEGWQAAFIIGGVGGLLAAAGTISLPESPRWLALGHVVREPKTTLVALAPARVALLMTLQFLQPLAVLGFLILSGLVLARKGYDVRHSLLYVAVSALGAPIGALAASWVVDRLPRHTLFIGCATCLILLGLGFALARAPAQAMGFGLCYMVVSVIFTLTLSIYGAEMFPTLRRGTAQGLGQATNRLGAAAVPLALLPLLSATDPVTLFAVIGATLILSIALVALYGPRSAAVEAAVRAVH